MRNDIQEIKAKHIQPGMVICYKNSRYDTVVDEVEWTRDGEVLVRTGVDGTGSEWFQPEEIVWIRVD